MASAGKKVNMIAQIVRLRQVVRRWKTKSHASSSSAAALYSGEPTGSNRKNPAGSISVYVGLERTRFIIPTRFLNLPVFVALLEQAEEQFGFQAAGGLALPCKPDFFSEMLQFLQNDEQRFGCMELDEFLNAISEPGHLPLYDDFHSCKESCSHAFTTRAMAAQD